MIGFTPAVTQNSNRLFFILQTIININMSILIPFCKAEKDMDIIFFFLS
jgi:hypothetical protein